MKLSKRGYRILLIFLAIIVCLSACQKIGLTTYPTNTATSSPTITQSQPPALKAEMLGWLKDQNGPVLLLYNNASSTVDLSLLNTETGNSFPVNLPENTHITTLHNDLSANQELLILIEKDPVTPSQNNLLIYDLVNDSISYRIPIDKLTILNGNSLFEKFPKEVMDALSARQLAGWVFEESLSLSLSTFSWKKDSNALLYTNSCLDGFACLFEYNMQNGKSTQLENEPGYFDSIKLSPDGTKILQVKSPVPQLTDFSLITPLIINPSGSLIYLPIFNTDGIYSSSYDWLDNQTLIITEYDFEQKQYSSLSLYDLNTGQITRISKGAFTAYLSNDDSLVLLTSSGDGAISEIKIYQNSIMRKSMTIQDNCKRLIHAPNSDYPTIVSCSMAIYGITPEVGLDRVISLPGNIVFSPDGNYLLHYPLTFQSEMHSELTIFSTIDFEPIRKLPVEIIRQVMWYPDSQGFLFLSQQGLINVFPIDGEPNLIYHVNTDDYRKLDALWFQP